MISCFTPSNEVKKQEIDYGLINPGKESRESLKVLTYTVNDRIIILRLGDWLLAGNEEINMQEIHSFSKLSISEGATGDIYAELDSGHEVLIISSNGSDEHERICEWHRSSERTEDDYNYDELLAEAEEQNENEGE